MKTFYSKYSKFQILRTLFLLIFFGILFGTYSFSGSENNNDLDLTNISALAVVQENTLISLSNPANPPDSSSPPLKVVKKIPVIITAYSSTHEQTDDTPYITASGSLVRDGIVANNFLAFGTKIKIPELYGDKVFIVEDRMSWKKGNYHIDIWFSDYWQAISFGAKRTHILVLEK